ncbi:MAG: hypothetical protein GDA36_05770 [Rhodobacteraceae bacterium]|nr:hypothetical protein [Paracoccaceae bacterium]
MAELKLRGNYQGGHITYNLNSCWKWDTYIITAVRLTDGRFARGELPKDAASMIL